MLVNISVYATLVCKQSCKYLGINCFTIPYPPPNKTTTTTTEATNTKTTSVVAEASSDESTEENDKTL